MTERSAEISITQQTVGKPASSDNPMEVVVHMLLNVISGVGIIFVNKLLVFGVASFPFGTALTFIHFIVVALGCRFFASMSFFEPKPLALLDVLPISLAYCGYVVFNNLSLLTNSVSVYQCAKIFCTPVVAGLEMAYERHSPTALVSLIPICYGVLITVYSDSSITTYGLVAAGLAVFSNSLYTVWGKRKQIELKASAMQLLLYQSAMSTVVLFFFIPVFDDWRTLITYRWTYVSFICLGLSAVFAFSVNFSFFLSVAKTSGLTMNILGYFKTCIVFLVGAVVTADVPSPQQFVGIVTTLAGLALFMWARLAPDEDRAVRNKNLMAAVMFSILIGIFPIITFQMFGVGQK